MADNNEEFNEVQEDLIEQLAELARQGKLTADDLKKLDKASGSQKSKMEQLGKATSTLAGGFINFTASVAQGNTELTSMKGLVSAAGEAFAGMLEAIPFVG
ncbi:MAG: hypothetical protein GWN01_09795, partial [Nitrosopumilaceae archaeon]|nr:hypothetical protein [Nitrosopumilaceae archaeon]NIU85958.1 hypothetical protein [Nitrosopumilaceae archaeon]NIV66025.1 hypothetical protein [Nitrosopumilaceae archaeon]NIX61799.1 hypothetical protein [Nitrosopumilaceae archaeon]